MKRIAATAAVTLALGAPAAGATEWSQAEPVTVVASEYQFSPKDLVFKRGIAYRLHIENRGGEMHEFTAPEFFRSAEIRDPAVLNVDRTEIEIPPGKSKDFDFVPRAAGHYPLRCSDHDWAGMTGAISVE